MKEILFVTALLFTPSMGFAWCESNADCPSGYYCSKHGVYVGSYCQKLTGFQSNDVMGKQKRCWWSDEDCDPGQHCEQKSEYIPGYCI